MNRDTTVVTKIVRSVKIDEFERRSFNSFTKVTFEDGAETNFGEFNVNPRGIEGLGISFNENDPVRSLRIDHPFAYILKSEGLSSKAIGSIEKELGDDDPEKIEDYLKAALIKLKNNGTLSIRNVGPKLKAKINELLSIYQSKSLFIPFSIKYELFDYVWYKLENSPNGKISSLFGRYKEWFKNTYDSILRRKGGINGAIPHDRLTDVFQAVYDEGVVTDKMYILMLLNHVENIVYKKTEAYKNGSDFDPSTAERYDIDDTSGRYVPIRLERGEYDFDTEVDLKKYFKETITEGKTDINRYCYYDYVKSALDPEHGLFLKNHYFKGAIAWELLLSGLSFDQVGYFLNNLQIFEELSPYSFGRRENSFETDDEADKNIPKYTHKEIEILINKSGYNRRFNLADGINRFISEKLNYFCGEHIYLNTVNTLKRGARTWNMKANRMYDPSRDGKMSESDLKDFYEYGYYRNEKFADFEESVLMNIDRAGFFKLVNYEGDRNEVSQRKFYELLEEYVAKNSDVFMTVPYEINDDDWDYFDRYARNGRAYPLSGTRPSLDLPLFSKIGLKSNDLMELRIYNKIIEASQAADAFKDDGNFEQWVADEESQNAFKFTDEQKEALRKAYTLPRIFVLSGYAGTGKSTITKSIVGRFKQLGYKENVGCSLAGVAANRLSILTDLPCKTVHSLLKYSGGDVFLAPSKLDYDLIVLDEASMIDSALFKELIVRIDFSRTSLVIIGDDAQLPPIGKGAPFADLVTAIKENLINIPSAVLTVVQRSAGNIVIQANNVREGRFDDIKNAMYDEANRRYATVEKVNDGAVARRIDRRYVHEDDAIDFDIYANPTYGEFQNVDVSSQDELLEKTLAIFDDFTKDENGNYVYERFAGIQIISPVKRSGGALSVNPINKLIQERVHAESTICAKIGRDGLFYIGDKVIHVKNQDMKEAVSYLSGFEDKEFETKVYNGQIGRVVDIDEVERYLTVVYPQNGQLVKYDFAQANELINLAYCLTAHKVQGNEFDTVVNMIPFYSCKITGQYLYSSYTRAKKRLYVLGQKRYLEEALEKKSKSRYTRMLKLFKERKTKELKK